MNRGVNTELGRERQNGFLKRQLEDQVKRLQKENLSLTKQLNAVKKCAMCTCHEERLKQAAALDELIHSGMRSTTASSATLPPVDPEQPQPQMTCREIQTLRDANDSLQACVDNLQQVLKEKALETVRMEQQYLEDIKERDRQVDSLHRQLQERMRLTSSTASREEAYSSRTSAFLKERELLMRKVQQLEEQLQKCQFSGSLGSAFVQLNMDPLEPTSTRSRYCETCNQLANDLNKIRDLDKAQRKAFSTSVASSCGSSVPQPKDVHLSKEVDLLKEKLKKQTEEAKQELQRYNANEELIRKQRDMVCAEYDRVLKRCEALEVELSKRRQAELSRQQQQAVGFDVVGVNEANIPTNDALRAELRKAYGRIKILETELAAEKNGDVAGDISANSHLTILRSNMQQLEQCKRNCERRLADQEETLRQLESDIALLMDEKADLKRRCAHLERLSNEAVAENTKHLKAIHELRFELTCAQEKESASTRAHLAEIETYQRLLKQKEAERAMFIEQLREDVQPVHLDDSSPIIEQEGSLERQRLVEVKEQLENLTAENEKLTSEMDRLKSDLSSTGTQLRCKQEELEREIAQNNVLQQQLADAQKLISEKDAQLLEANNQLKVLDLNLVKLETELANANDHLEAERESNATLKNAVDEFEELLREKTDELVASNIESQRANSDAQRHKETVFDLETKLALQGRELRNTRAKLLDLKTKIKRLEREAAELSPRSAPSTGRTTASSMLTKSPSASPSL